MSASESSYARALRRVGALERRVTVLASDLGTATTSSTPPVQADLNHTMRVAWELLAALRGTLLSLEERATRVVPAVVAGLVALWTQLYTFDPGASRALAWTAWAILLVAVWTLARLVMPSRLDRFWTASFHPSWSSRS